MLAHLTQDELVGEQERTFDEGGERLQRLLFFSLIAVKFALLFDASIEISGEEDAHDESDQENDYCRDSQSQDNVSHDFPRFCQVVG